jgi:two-component sensor histidine kinase
MYLKDLIETIENSFADTEKDLSIEVVLSHLSLSINQAIPCSLFINEVIVNSFKHAFEHQESGKIFVKMKEENERVYLELRDNGKGLPDTFEAEEAETLGMTLLHTLTKQLSGDLQIYNDDGVVCKLEFPIE